MATISSKLPVRGVSSDIQVGVANSSDVRIDPATEGGNLATIAGDTTSIDTKTPSLGQALMAASVPVVIASNQSTVPVSLSGDQPVDLTKVAGTATAVNTGNANNGTQRVVLASDQPAIPVTFSAGNLNALAYNRGVGIAANGTSSHSWTPGANAIVKRIYISGSGQMNGEIKYGTTGAEATTAWLFATKGDLNPYIEFPDGLSVTTAQTIIIVRQNDDNQAQDLYSWIIYKNA